MVDVESLADMQRAIRLVRSRASEWGIDPERVGVMGFSAGGEIAALAATRFSTARCRLFEQNQQSPGLAPGA
jgi:endo-1,4-beta-xylanase